MIPGTHTFVAETRPTIDNGYQGEQVTLTATEGQRFTGVVDMVNLERGYAFILEPLTEARIYAGAHGTFELTEGAEVEFSLVNTRKGIRAVQIRPAKEPLTLRIETWVLAVNERYGFLKSPADGGPNIFFHRHTFPKAVEQQDVIAHVLKLSRSGWRAVRIEPMRPQGK